MKDEIHLFLAEVAAHPATFGLGAALARWWIGDRSEGWKSFSTYIITSLFVAWGASLYLIDEGLTPGRKSAYLLLLAFVAKDALMAVVGLGAQFAANPLDIIRRVRRALNGGPDNEPPKP